MGLEPVTALSRSTHAIQQTTEAVELLTFFCFIYYIWYICNTIFVQITFVSIFLEWKRSLLSKYSFQIGVSGDFSYSSRFNGFPHIVHQENEPRTVLHIWAFLGENWEKSASLNMTSRLTKTLITQKRYIYSLFTKHFPKLQ